MSRRLRLALVASCAAAFAVTSTPALADSGSISIDTGSGWSHDVAEPLFAVDHMAPGWSASKAIAVRNDGGATASLTLAVTDLDDDENGCSHAELTVDSTCTGDDAGELGHEMRLSVFAGDSSSTPVWQGSVDDLAVPVILDGADAPGQVDGFRIEAQLPADAGNETQTDTVAFGLRLTLSGAGDVGTVAVKGVKVTRPPTAVGTQRALPFTGSPIEGLLTGGLCLLVIGIHLLRASQFGRRR